MSKREEITEAVKGALDDALLCSRVWEAWTHNTMTEDDFSQASDNEEFVEQIVDAVIAALPSAFAVPSARVSVSAFPNLESAIFDLPVTEGGTP